jgi:hypothetical protein
VNEAYANLPLSFEANRGQTDQQVKFISRGNGYTLFLTPSEAVIQFRIADFGLRIDSLKSEIRNLKSQIIKMRFVAANANPSVVGLEQLSGKVNYIFGTDPTKWRTGVASYAKVKYENVYPGVDLVYYGNQQQLEYDFVVAPGADPNTIALEFAGADKLELDADGNLLLDTAGGQIRQHKPTVYQDVTGIRQEIPGGYVLLEQHTDHASRITHQVGFHVESYDPTRPLIIDPVLVYSTYLGGSGYENNRTIGSARGGIAVDADGNVYVTGRTESRDFPTASAFQPTNKGGFFNADVFVAKFNPAGSALVYSTYLGGSKDEEGRDIAVDADGNAYVTGATGLNSSDFPTTPGAFKTRDGGVFVTKLSPTGALVYSAHFGGFLGAEGNDIAVDMAGNAYVTGETFSDDFPITPGTAFQTVKRFNDAFVTVLNATGSGLRYSTYLGGSRTEEGVAIAVDTSGNAYVTGTTNSSDLPTANPLQRAFGGGFDDAFVAKLNPLAPGSASLVYSTYLGGNGSDQGRDIAVDGAGNAYVTGETSSSNFPVMSALQPTFGGTVPQADAFVTKLSAAGSTLVYSTYLGGESNDEGNDIAVDGAGNAYVIGTTFSLDFPIVNPFLSRSQRQSLDSNDAFVTKLNAAGSGLIYSSLLGGDGHVHETGLGIAVDAGGNAYVTGQTDSTDFPTVNPLQPAIGGSCQPGPCPDAFVAKIADSPRLARSQPK